ncbi:hypothetical protein Q8F55_003113 [Vanrija albida]|uniref:Telomeric single stranded DNA binding POT1/Cdc13 domain-containing protein n=1 Tax=Vanrija albida TaxID=181172 RepID=A0ABR3QBL8_9TREE
MPPRARSTTPTPTPTPPRTQLLAVPPPPAPDLAPSGALLLPLASVGAAHVGRKLRLVVQVLAVDASGAHALVSTPASGTRPTLMVALSAALLGQSPAARSVRPPAWGGQELAQDARERLYLAFGEWIAVVGWLEAAESLPSVAIPHGCAHPPLAILEAIHVAPARPPPQDAVFRGQLN